MKITIATSADQIPQELQCLTDDRGRSVDEIIEQKELYFCDFWELQQGELDEEQGVYYHQAMAPGGMGRQGPVKYWYAPQLACYKNADGKLNILGFILTRHTDKPNVVYNAKSTPPNLYTLAKLHLTCADNQHHQFITHLGLAHLVMEPLAIANHNVFTPGEDRHPIGTLLHPHFHDTIGINFLARQTLVSEIAPFTDATFSPGTVNALKIFSVGYQEWDFLGDNFVNNLKKRGFDEVRSDDVDGYYYRDDGFKVWNAFKKHFSNIICGLYESDDKVAKDEHIQAWCDELCNPDLGDIKSFPSSITTRELLAEVITSIVFYCSAQHAAVNFSQLEYVSYVPNRPDSLRLPMPPAGSVDGDIGAENIFIALPSIGNGQFQTMFAYLLTTPPDNMFSDYNCMVERFPLETARFKNELEKIHLQIKSRNEMLAAEGEIGYPYLDPMEFPQSINI